MGPRTRSVTGSPVKQKMQSQESTDTDRIIVLIAPTDISKNARILSLRHPRDDAPKKFLFCPQRGLFELIKASCPPSDPRSMLFTCASDKTQEQGSGSLHAAVKNRVSSGFVCENAAVMAATPYDLAFLLMHILAPGKSSTRKLMFQPIDDLLEETTSRDKNLLYVVREGHEFVQRAMTQICDTVDAGDENMFRYSEDRVLQKIVSKAEAVVAHGLPASLEERFVLQVLQTPMLSIKSDDELSTALSDTPTQLSGASVEESSDSQSSIASSAVSAVFSETSSTSTVMTTEHETTKPQLLRLQRLKVAVDFVMATNLSTTLSNRLQEVLASPNSPIDFKELQKHLQHVASLRAEAIASQSISNFSRKRGHTGDDEAAEARAEKKRKQEEDEKKRKANESRGVRDLKKVNVSGMKKMSAFFAKAQPKK